MRIIALTCVLVLSSVLGGCGWTKPQPSTTTTITYFEQSSLFAGITSVGFEEAELIGDNYPEYPKKTVFWNIHGKTGSVASPNPGAYHVAWSSAVPDG